MNVDLFILSVAIINMLCCVWRFIFVNDDEKIDALTQTYDRKHMSKIETLEDAGDNFYVVFSDIDFFKKINDTYGHDAGDEVLKAFSGMLKSSFKFSQDHIVRWGGEEFLIFIYVKNKDIFTKDLLHKKIELLRKNIELMQINYNDEIITLTSSFGICIDTSISIHERIKKADRALYHSKENGRNMITFFSELA